MNKKILTVSIAGYNVEKYIRQTLDSLCCQNVSKLEVFIVDDGGKDKTLSIAKEYEARYPDTFHPIHKENGGWGSTVNYSINHATGKYFKLLDGDDYFNVENLDKVVKYLEDTDADVVYNPYRRFEDGSEKTIGIFDESSKIQLFHTLNLIDLPSDINLGMHALIFKTNTLQVNKVSVLENHFYTDTEYKTKGLAFSNTIVFTDWNLYNYRIGRDGQSVSLVGLKKHYSESIDVVDELILFSEKNKNRRNYNFILNNVRESCIFAYMSLLALNKRREFIELDNKLKIKSNLYDISTNTEILSARKTKFAIFYFQSILLKIRIKLAPVVHKLLGI